MMARGVDGPGVVRGHHHLGVVPQRRSRLQGLPGNTSSTARPRRPWSRASSRSGTTTCSPRPTFTRVSPGWPRASRSGVHQPAGFGGERGAQHQDPGAGPARRAAPRPACSGNFGVGPGGAHEAVHVQAQFPQGPADLPADPAEAVDQRHLAGEVLGHAARAPSAAPAGRRGIRPGAGPRPAGGPPRSGPSRSRTGRRPG